VSTPEQIYINLPEKRPEQSKPLRNAVSIGPLPSNSCANPISVFSPLIADTAVFALNAGLWFRRGRLPMVFSSLEASCCGCAESPLNQPVQYSRATSLAKIRKSRQSKIWIASLGMLSTNIKKNLSRDGYGRILNGGSSIQDQNWIGPHWLGAMRSSRFGRKIARCGRSTRFLELIVH